MARKTKRTIRKQPPITRELLKLGNDLHRINARLLVLAERVADKEVDSAALQKFMVSFKEQSDG